MSSAHRAGSNLYLHAFSIALNATSDKEKWFTSTIQLELVSLQLCLACRDASELHLRVEEDTPRYLWINGPARTTRSSKILRTSRVPTFRPREITWKWLNTALSQSLRESDSGPLGNLDSLTLDDDFNQYIYDVVWPMSLRRLTFGKCFNWPLDTVSWPPSLQLLHLGETFDRP